MGQTIGSASRAGQPLMIDIRRAGLADAASVADLFLASFRTALPTVRRVHSDEQVRTWIRDHVLAETETWVALEADQIVGMVSLAPGWLEHLYIAPDRLGEGIGRRLLELAKERAEGSLELWTFQVNDRARRFYEHHGFVAIEQTDGSGNEEHEPDIRYRWTAGKAIELSSA